jgi:hypothetical protein
MLDLEGTCEPEHCEAHIYGNMTVIRSNYYLAYCPSRSTEARCNIAVEFEINGIEVSLIPPVDRSETSEWPYHSSDAPTANKDDR